MKLTRKNILLMVGAPAASALLALVIHTLILLADRYDWLGAAITMAVAAVLIARLAVVTWGDQDE